MLSSCRLVDPNTGGDLSDRKIDVVDQQHGRVAPCDGKKIILTKEKAASKNQAGLEYDLTIRANRKPQFCSETA